MAALPPPPQRPHSPAKPTPNQGHCPAPAGCELASGAFIGEHGPWNRKPRSGYKVVFVAFDNGQPVGLPLDVLTGFVSPEGKAWGRPVGVAIDPRGALRVADDVGNAVWRATATGAADFDKNRVK